jgi:dienelactone hydrolase
LDSVASDIAAAAKAVLAAPCRELFLWGRCGGATAILNTLSTLPNVTKVVAINPWLPDTTPTNGGTVIDHCFDEILNYRGQLLLVLTNGPTADQWRSLLLTHAAGRMVAAAKHVTWYNFPQANHAISDRRHLRQLLANALSWSADEISIEAKR